MDLGALRLVTAVATQGRHAKGQGQEYTPAYTLSYWRPGMPDFAFYSAHPSKANKVRTVALFQVHFTSKLLAADGEMMAKAQHQFQEVMM